MSGLLPAPVHPKPLLALHDLVKVSAGATVMVSLVISTPRGVIFIYLFIKGVCRVVGETASYGAEKRAISWGDELMWPCGGLLGRDCGQQAQAKCCIAVNKISTAHQMQVDTLTNRQLLTAASSHLRKPESSTVLQRASS